MDEELKKEIRAYAIQNAADFEGKANQGTVIGRLIGTHPDIKSKLKDISRDISEIVKEVNSLSIEEINKELESLGKEFEKEKKEEKKDLRELSNAQQGKVVMRMAPSPSGPLHIGHSYVLSLNDAYCKKYDGKFILRLEDTNPENIYKPAYDMIPDDAKWLTKDNVSEVIIQSDRLEIYYKYARELVDMGNAYVCECDSDTFRELVFKKIACPCRELSIKEQQQRFEKMFEGYSPGEAVLRSKTDIEHKNPAMRDFPLMRINENTHPRQGDKYRVWPLMNLSVFVDDVESGMTHIIRGKDHMDNARRQELLYKFFNKNPPESLFLGRINFKGLEVSSSKTRLLIEEGKYEGWDDIRLPFLPALKRRGYQPEAFVKYALDVGVSQTDKTVEVDDFFKSLNNFNKEVIDSEANRYFFIKEPVKIDIDNAPEQNIELKLHPNFNRGSRIFKTKNLFYVEKEDFDFFENTELIRLMDCLNFRKEGEKFEFISTEYEDFKKSGKKIIHWLAANEMTCVSVRMPDNSIIKGEAELSVKKLNQGDIIQFERFGFCRLDSKENMEFWFCHK